MKGDNSKNIVYKKNSNETISHEITIYTLSPLKAVKQKNAKLRWKPLFISCLLGFLVALLAVPYWIEDETIIERALGGVFTIVLSLLTTKSFKL